MDHVANPTATVTAQTSDKRSPVPSHNGLAQVELVCQLMEASPFARQEQQGHAAAAATAAAAPAAAPGRNAGDAVPAAPRPAVAIITPHRAQRRALRAAAQGRPWGGVCRVETVERMQVGRWVVAGAGAGVGLHAPRPPPHGLSHFIYLLTPFPQNDRATRLTPSSSAPPSAAARRWRPRRPSTPTCVEPTSPSAAPAPACWCWPAAPS